MVMWASQDGRLSWETVVDGEVRNYLGNKCNGISVEFR